LPPALEFLIVDRGRFDLLINGGSMLRPNRD
jgi:hypothetical protein